MLIQRAMRFYKNHGIVGFCKQAGVKIRNMIFIKPDIIYFIDIARLSSFRCRLKDACQVIVRDMQNPFTSREIEQMSCYIYPEMLQSQIKERFSLGAKVWLLKKEDRCIGMVWTIVGKTVEPFYYMIGSQDVHFFNNEIFEPYRSKGFNPPLIEYVLFQMKSAGFVRAYIETNQRNIAEQRSLSKTSFEMFGKAIKLSLGKKNITLWSASH